MDGMERRILDVKKKKKDEELFWRLAINGGSPDRFKDAQYEFIGRIDRLQRLVYKQAKRWK